MSYMDTIAISYHLPLSPAWIETWGKNSETKGCKTYQMKLNFMGNKSIMVTYHPTDMNGDPIPSLIYTFSLPNMVGNCNHNLVFDMDEAIEEANRLLNGRDKLPPVKVEEGIIYRIDPVYQYQVGGFVQDYVSCLLNAHYSHRETNPYKYRGVVFPSYHSTTKFYGKQQQCHHPEAYGYLRHEKTIRGTSYIEKILGKRELSVLGISRPPTIPDITNSFIKAELDKDRERLGLNGTLICNREAACEMLINSYGRIMGEKLIGFWLMRQGCTREQLVSSYGYDVSSVNRKEKMIRDAGVSLVSSARVALPPLSIEM